MNPDFSDIEKIQTAFYQMRTRQDFLEVLNLAKPMLYGVKAVPFEMKQLTWYSGSWSAKRRYRQFNIKKKSGGERTINAPVRGLKVLQKTLALIIQCVFEPHDAAKGFTKGKSIVDNARLHERSYYVYNLDLKDFFPSIEQARVWACLQLKPFYLKDDTYSKESASDYTKSNLLALKNEYHSSERIEIAKMIANICCAEMEVERKDENGNWITMKKNVLPQGAPTSPVLTNVICQKLDFLLTGVAKRFGLKYSRYADDITFSSMHNVYQKDSEFNKELYRIITQQGFHIKESKTRLQKTGYRKEVTGLLVNEKVNVQKRYIKQFRMWLYYWEVYGYEKANHLFTSNYLKDKGHIKRKPPVLEDVIHGKLQYLKMVKSPNNKIYTKLEDRLNILIFRDLHHTKNYKKNKEPLIAENQKKQEVDEKLFIPSLIEDIFISGLDAAMTKFKKLSDELQKRKS